MRLGLPLDAGNEGQLMHDPSNTSSARLEFEAQPLGDFEPFSPSNSSRESPELDGDSESPELDGLYRDEDDGRPTRHSEVAPQAREGSVASGGHGAEAPSQS